MFDSPPSPPMPCVPPPPPPSFDEYKEEPYGIALYDFEGETMEDLSFKMNEKIYLLSRLNEEWYMGRDRRGLEGMFPVNYVEVKVPLSSERPQQPDESVPTAKAGTQKVRALYQFTAETADDLTIREHPLNVCAKNILIAIRLAGNVLCHDKPVRIDAEQLSVARLQWHIVAVFLTGQLQCPSDRGVQPFIICTIAIHRAQRAKGRFVLIDLCSITPGASSFLPFDDVSTVASVVAADDVGERYAGVTVTDELPALKYLRKGDTFATPQILHPVEGFVIARQQRPEVLRDGSSTRLLRAGLRFRTPAHPSVALQLLVVTVRCAV